jgi:hypothetical protein
MLESFITPPLGAARNRTEDFKKPGNEIGRPIRGGPFCKRQKAAAASGATTTNAYG